MNYNIIKVSREEYDSWETYPEWASERLEDLGFSFQYAFYPEYEEDLPAIDYALFALGDESILGYCTINVKNCVDTLEVFPRYRLQGIAKWLLKEANCYTPWCNENKRFWRHIELTLAEHH